MTENLLQSLNSWWYNDRETIFSYSLYSRPIYKCTAIKKTIWKTTMYTTSKIIKHHRCMRVWYHRCMRVWFDFVSWAHALDDAFLKILLICFSNLKLFCFEMISHSKFTFKKLFRYKKVPHKLEASIFCECSHHWFTRVRVGLAGLLYHLLPYQCMASQTISRQT